MKVTWPPPVTNSRVGGYGFLGGEAEAARFRVKGLGFRGVSDPWTIKWTRAWEKLTQWAARGCEGKGPTTAREPN